MFDTATLQSIETTDQGIVRFVVSYTGPDVKPVTRVYEQAGLLKDAYLVNEATAALGTLNAARTVTEKLQPGMVLVTLA
jgi:hypothetical protein